MTVFFIVLSVVLVLSLPIFANIYIAFDKDKKALKAEIFLFKISVFKFNLIVKGVNFYIKRSFKRPYIVTISPQFKKPKFMPKIRHISVIFAETFYNFGINDEIFTPLFIISAINTVQNETAEIIRFYKPNLRQNHIINVYFGERGVAVYFHLKTVFNLLDVLFNLFYYLSEKIHYAR